jgi:predicted phosphodiesterase
MRVALISDLHANFEALRSVAPLLAGADRVICLGDLVGYYCQVNEVLDYCRQNRFTCVLGNHDHWALTGCPSHMNEAVRFGVDFAAANLSAQNRDWLAGLPLALGTKLAGTSAFFCHGSPWSPLTGYLHSDSSEIADLDRFDYDLIAFGQTHRSQVRASGKQLILNPGSVGQSRDLTAVACAAIVETETLHVEELRAPYDVQPVIDLARNHGAGRWISKHLESSRCKEVEEVDARS